MTMHPDAPRRPAAPRPDRRPHPRADPRAGRRTGRAPAIADPSGAAAALGALGLAPARAPAPVPEERRRGRHLTVVEPGARSAAQRRRRARALVIAAIGVATCIGLALVYLHVVLAQRQFRIDKLDTQVQKAQADYQNLRLQVAELGSPGQVISTAEGQLGMVQPTKVVYLSPAPGTSRPPTSGAPAAAPASPGAAPVAGVNGVAPAGDADWPQIKSQLAGAP